AGAHASALLYSLVESARINGLNPYDYLLALLTSLKSPDEDIDTSFAQAYKILKMA
ncbi:transposase domain-containing protein, partial [Arsenophonus sp. ENCA]|uniref:transposase domain-containing protein n=1 Tax=Arsenophonus sp. ENCA TaxID=1987579 RepID=UPI0025BDBD0F